MSNENMKMNEGFSVEKTVAGLVGEPKARHRVIGWTVVVSALAGIIFGGITLFKSCNSTSIPSGDNIKMEEGLTPTKKLQGYLTFNIVDKLGNLKGTYGPYKNTIVNAGETALRDCFGGTGTPTCTAVQAFKYHGLGTSSAAIAEADTGCTTELTTQYNPDSTRATGSQTNNGANIYRTVGTNTVDASVTVAEFCLMSQAATGGGTMWSRILVSPTVGLNSGDSLQSTYDLTIE